MTWHVFERGSPDSLYWANVLPGDGVQGPGTFAYKAADFANRNEDRHTRPLILAHAPLLVLSRQPGIPGEVEPLNADLCTFVVLSRHGILVILKAFSSV